MTPKERDLARDLEEVLGIISDWPDVRETTREYFFLYALREYHRHKNDGWASFWREAMDNMRDDLDDQALAEIQKFALDMGCHD